MRRWLAVVLVSILPGLPGASAAESRSMLALDWQGSRFEGTELGRGGGKLQLLSRDGRVFSVPTAEAKSVRTLPLPFHSYTAMEMRAQLTRELGKSFEVTSTGHYLVAHPSGQRDAWSQRFEDLYRHFIHYFAVRGLQPHEPEFPLVAIVFHNHQEFLQYANRERSNTSANVLGYYSHNTNRITLFDAGGGKASSAAGQETANTIIHEATHQTAYNTGVHRRLSGTPKWVTEGLATMFEAPGVWKAEDNRRPEDRINRGRLTGFKFLAGRRKPGFMADMIASDRIFERDVDQAYANAWAFSFYLVETQHQRYCDYLKLTAKRRSFTNYSAAERMTDFTSVFGTNLRTLETHFERYMTELK
jgi:Protein of unknown function (DUF1570)